MRGPHPLGEFAHFGLVEPEPGNGGHDLRHLIHVAFLGRRVLVRDGRIVSGLLAHLDSSEQSFDIERLAVVDESLVDSDGSVYSVAEGQLMSGGVMVDELRSDHGRDLLKGHDVDDHVAIRILMRRADHHMGDVEIIGLAEVGVPHLVVLLLQFGGEEPAGSVEAFDALIVYKLFDLPLDGEPPVVVEDRELGHGILAVDTGLLDLQIVLLGRIGSLHGEIPGRSSRLGMLVLIGGFVPHAMLQARAARFALGGIFYEDAPVGICLQYLVEVLLDKRYSDGCHAAFVLIPVGVEVEIIGIPVLIDGIRDQHDGIVVRRAAVLGLNVLRQEHEKAVAPGLSAVDCG